ncbi:MAG TPA: thiol:disulfide interchange protein DsbG [Noviherbaspirillum sp.]
MFNPTQLLRHGIRGAASAAFFLLAAPLQAAADYPKAIADAVADGVKVLNQFPAASGMTGWVLSEGGRNSIVYTTPDRKTILVGSLVNENGENLTAQDAEKYLPRPDPDALLKELAQSSHVIEGTGRNPKSLLYVFVDANCPYCHLTWKALQPYMNAGLQVRWIPVATLGPSSMPKAIEVLGAKDKTAAFRKMEENSGKRWEPVPGFTEADRPEIAAAIRKNNELMGAFGISGTPGIVWKDSRGHMQMKAGMPRLSEIPAMTGLPEQKVNDPALAKFR